MFRNIWIILFVLVLCCLFTLIIIGIITQPKLPDININTGFAPTNKTCLREKVSCNTDQDCLASCSEAQEGEEIVCKSIPDIPALTPTQQTLFGVNVTTPPKYCVPAKAKLECSVATGGIPVFTGWGALNTMGFECMCAYPLWASARTCDSNTGACTGGCQLNPGICEGGTFDWDLTKKAQEPTADLCTCSSDRRLVIDNAGLPRCVPNDIVSFYNDLDITNQNGGQDQPIVSTGTKVTKLSDYVCPATGPAFSQNTVCKGFESSCCSIPNASCNSDGTCCPANLPVYDAQRGLCLKSGDTCTSDEKICSSGSSQSSECCPFKDGTCCSFGGCCPSNFPICDPDGKWCNPLPTLLLNSKCNSANSTQCINGCCPYTNGTCIGDPIDGKYYCCPPAYPNYQNGMCRKNEK